MTQSRQPEDRDLITRVARLEYRLTQIENTNTQLQQTIEPGGYVTDGFERVVDRIDEVEERLINRIDGVEERLRFESQIKHDELNTKIDEVKQEIKSQGAKLDAILHRLAGG
jgi:uncharacterized coiled-coil protein SlyX